MELGDCLPDLPSPPVGLVDGVRDRPKLESRHTGKGRSAQDSEALHCLDGSVPSTPDTGCGSDRQELRGRKGATSDLEEAGVGPCPVGHVNEPLSLAGVAVDGLRSDNDRGWAKPPRPCNTDVEEDVDVLCGERSRGRDSGLDRADAAAERVDAIDRVELWSGGGDEKHRTRR